jgi:hypothetical protein
MVGVLIMKSEKTPEKHKGPGPVMRIRVKRKDGQWKVVKRVHIPEMIIPFSDDAPPLNRSGQMAGFWFTAR